MRISALMIMVVVAGSHGMASESGKPPEQKVTVCMAKLLDPLAYQGQMIASKMFSAIGDRIDWRGDSNCPVGLGKAIRISLVKTTPPDYHPGALAFAMAYEGAHMEVFYDRVQSLGPHSQPYVMGHVLVHEITHLLQGVSRHSPSGVMKSDWNAADFGAMRKLLPFTEVDVRLIHLGLEDRASRLAAATLPRQ